MLRYLTVWKSLLIIVFFDTIMFSILFPDPTLCQIHSTSVSCTSQPSKILSDQSLCKWNNKTNYCTANPPPFTLSFILILAVIINVLALIPDVLLDMLIVEICAKRPKLELIGLNSVYWLGPDCTAPALIKFGEKSRQDINKPTNRTANSTEKVKFPMRSLEEEQEYVKETLLKYTKLKCSLDTPVRNLNKMNLSAMQKRHIKRCDFLQRKYNHAKLNHLGLEASMKSVGLVSARGSLMVAFPQSIVEQDIDECVKTSVLKAHESAEELQAAMDCFGEEDVQLKETFLMQNFIMEQFEGWRKSALELMLMRYFPGFVESVHPVVWILGWFLLICSILFFCYWIFAWGVTNTSDMIHAWGVAYGTAVAQDMLVFEMISIFINYVILVDFIRPQLRYIYLNFMNIVHYYQQLNINIENNKESTIVQIISPSCIASRDEKNNQLTSAKVLQRVTDVDTAIYRKNDMINSRKSFTEIIELAFLSLFNMDKAKLEVAENDVVINAKRASCGDERNQVLKVASKRIVKVPLTVVQQDILNWRSVSSADPYDADDFGIIGVGEGLLHRISEDSEEDFMSVLSSKSSQRFSDVCPDIHVTEGKVEVDTVINQRSSSSDGYGEGSFVDMVYISEEEQIGRDLDNEGGRDDDELRSGNEGEDKKEIVCISKEEHVDRELEDNSEDELGLEYEVGENEGGGGQEADTAEAIGSLGATSSSVQNDRRSSIDDEWWSGL